MNRATVIHGDCLYVMTGMGENTVDAVVCDPPYGLGFMGKHWDHGVPSKDVWAQCLRVLKPGGHLLAFAGTRTQHRMCCNIEDAGFEIRDMIAWIYGQGFPKSHNVALGIDKMFGHGNRGHRVAVANRRHPDGTVEPNGDDLEAYEGKCEQSRPWSGWGNNLKPAMEPITVARKPFEGTIVSNVLQHGTGAINVDDCRVPNSDAGKQDRSNEKRASVRGESATDFRLTGGPRGGSIKGRFPANVIHDGSEEVLGCFPDSPGQQGDLRGHNKSRKSPNGAFGEMGPARDCAARDDKGNKSASRFFYCSKADKEDRAGSKHPTVKPLDLMRYLCRLVTPPGGLVLDPFAGSGTTGQAAVEEGFRCLMIEREFEYVSDIRRRMEALK